MKYISLFSGIEAASVAWRPLGWEAVAFSEIEPFCCSLLKEKYPDVPNLGDIKNIDWTSYDTNVVIGGSPCQAFSYAGKRRGLMDERGLLMLEFVRCVNEIQPNWFIWENVAGVLSQDNGRAFETLLRELEQCGYCLAWRVLDAQYFGVAQQRRRVFVVGHNRIGPAAAVLFEARNMPGHAQKEQRERFASPPEMGACGPVSFMEHFEGGARFTNGHGQITGTILTSCHSKGAPMILDKMRIRRLTILEMERLQGFPDGYTDIKGATFSKREKALGNSMAVPVIRWLGERIEKVQGLI